MTAHKTINQPAQMPGARLPTERARDVAFAKRLQQLMNERELSQSDLAAKIWHRYTNTEGKHVARGRDRISVWIRGKNFPDAANLAKLAKALDVKVSDLAPTALVKAAHHGAADWSITKPHGGEPGQVFLQISQFVAEGVAWEIQGLLMEEGHAKKRRG